MTKYSCYLVTADNKAEVCFFIEAETPAAAAEEARSRGNHQGYASIEVWNGAQFGIKLELTASSLTNVPNDVGAVDVLVVDDETMVRVITANLLREEGFNVAEAASGNDALDKCAGGLSFSVLLTDVRMPDMTGFELANRVINFFPSTKVIYMTGYPVKESGPLDVMRPGAELLHKPVPILRLAGAVRRALGSHQTFSARPRAP